MQSKRSRTRPDFAISTARHRKTIRGLDPPTDNIPGVIGEAGGLTYLMKRGMLFRFHHPARNILPLRLRAVKGRKLFPLTVLVYAATDAQRDGSNGYHLRFNRGSRLATSLSNGVAARSCKHRFQTEHKLHFLHKQGLEEVDEAYDEFESAA